jgi:hypothetical protein
MTDAQNAEERGDPTAPDPGLADAAPELQAESDEGIRETDPGHTEPPLDDERSHEADFAPGGYDDRETDGLSKMPGE